MTPRNAGPIDLDDPSAYRALDADGMLDRIHEFPAEVQKAWDLAMRFDVPAGYSDIDKVVVLGMGGSAIGGDLIASLVSAESRVPITVHRGYSLPAYVDARTLVIASSYSGNTEETLTCFEQSVRSGAHILAITTGGRLKTMAEKNNVPVFVFDYQSPPRAALPYSLITLMCFLQNLRIIRDRDAEVREAVAALHTQAERTNETVPVARNPAKTLARELHGRVPIIYGAEILAEVAHRWKTQINENSKSWSFYELFPELDHNAVVGYDFPASAKDNLGVVMLTSERLSPRVLLRYEVTSRLLQKAGIWSTTARGSGGSALAEVLTLVLLGDYASYYLALLNGTAPGPVDAIDYLKAEMGKART